MSASRSRFDLIGPPPTWPSEVRSFLDTHNSSGLYGTAEWLDLLAQSVDFGPGIEADAAVLTRQDRPALVVPLLRSARRRELRSLANYYSPLAAPAGIDHATATDWAELFAGLVALQPRPKLLQFGPWPQALAQSDVLKRAARQSGYVLAPHFRFGNWHWRVDRAWADYWQSRDSALRNTVQRKGRKFARAGGRLEVITGTSDVERGLAAFVEVYANSWKSAEPHPAFMPGLVRLAAQHGWLRLGVAWLDDHAVAAQLWLVHGGRAEIYKLAYREQHADLGAGSLLTAELMRHVVEIDQVNEVDYGMGDEPYKKAWTPQRRERWGCLVAPVWSIAGMRLSLSTHIRV